VFGNIHLADVRAWYEERTTARGLEHVEPLWGDAPRDLVHEVLARGYRTRVVSVDLARGRRDWLGRELDAEFAAEIAMHPGVDPAGEQGEYHTFVFAGPLFRSEITYQIGEIHEEEGHVQVDVLPES
jgi:diphthamide synthase (EF-2-diphthine--ammonia ligase)